MFDIELKLQLSPQSIAALNKSELLSEPHVHRSQHAIYFDTADHKLFNAGISLRIRKEGGRLVQTVKCAKAKSGGLFRRAEWEILIDADTLVLDGATPVRDLLGDRLGTWCNCFRSMLIARSGYCSVKARRLRLRWIAERYVWAIGGPRSMNASWD
ncbi:CYTH domain-containing protein [Paracoccus litorisediminis]|uniref:CYTH domain-containing protein n=1 Tax=Paracoccus litorisediminis TaxID=2006130 RepID=UPI001478F5EC